VTVTGEIVGLSADALAKLKLSFVNTDMVYVPNLTISGTTITAKLEKDVTYQIVADNINDYCLSDISTISESADATQNINFSLKPTMFGLLIDEETCYRYIREVVLLAASKNSFIRIDMEDSQCVDREIELLRKLHREFPKNVGLVVQSYLRRTLSDLESLLELHTENTPLNYRLCKGIYVEPEKIAYKKYDEVREHFLEDLEFMFKNKIYVGIATHDQFLVENSYQLIEKYQVPKSMYEFQMLYGVTPELRQSIIDNGHKMRVYVPFGKQWFNYSTRRLKENPKVASHIIKALFIRG